MTPHEFIQKWQAAQLAERAACHEHFLDLCDLLDQPKPAAADPEGAWYTYERGVRKSLGEPEASPPGAYDWDPTMTDDNLLAALLALNLERAEEDPPRHHPLAAPRFPKPQRRQANVDPPPC